MSSVVLVPWSDKDAILLDEIAIYGKVGFLYF